MCVEAASLPSSEFKTRGLSEPTNRTNNRKECFNFLSGFPPLQEKATHNRGFPVSLRNKIKNSIDVLVGSFSRTPSWFAPSKKVHVKCRFVLMTC